MIECPNCQNLNDENNQFCGKCGAKLPNPKYCPKCNYHSYTDDFCTKCGEKLVSKERYEKIINKMISLRQQAYDFKDKKEFDKAIKYYDEVLKIRPDDTISLLYKRNIYQDLGKYEKAIECCDKEIEIDPKNNLTYLFKGNYLTKLGEFKEAIKCYDKSILIDSNYYSPYVAKGRALLELGKIDDALYCFDKALKIKNDEPYNFILVASILCNFFKFEEAFDFCESGLNYHPQNIGLIYEKAKILCLIGNDFEANELISKYNLNSAAIFNLVAHIFNLMGDFNKAMRYCNKSLDLDSQYSDSWLTKGEICFNLKKYDESLIYFKKGLDLSKNDKETIVNGLNKNCQEFVKSNLL